MSKVLTIIARIESKSENLDFIKSEVMKLVDLTRKERGCLQYDLHQDLAQPEVFIFVENWENKGLWELHMESNHLKNFIEVTDGFLKSLSINQMTKI